MFKNSAVLRMFKWPRFEVLGISRRDFALVFTLLFNAFTWSYMIEMIIENFPLNPPIKSALRTVFSIAASGAGFSGALLSEKVRRLRFIYFWMILGLLSSLPLIFINNITVGHLSIIFTLLGISFGLGMPSSLAHLADNSSIENRARISSLILLMANLSTLPLAILFMALNLVMSSLVLAVWRGLGLIILALMKPKEENFGNEKRQFSFISVFRPKSFSLYFLPWVMFILVDALEKALLRDFIGLEFFSFILTVEPIIAVFFMCVGGLLADKIGRKRVVIYGFISLGVGYAMVGLAPMMRIAWYFYIIVDGAAWGIFYTIFLLILWGDLSQPGTRENYYAIGNFPFLIRSMITLLFVTSVASFPANASFSLASFFLFLAVLPLMYAPETLPEKKMELRRLKGYIEQARKVREKYLRKTDAAES